MITKLIDLIAVIEVHQNILNAIEYDSDTPLHYKDYREMWIDYGYNEFENITDDKILDEALKYMNGIIFEMEHKIAIYDDINNETKFEIECKKNNIDTNLIIELFFNIKENDKDLFDCVTYQVTTQDEWGNETDGNYKLDIKTVINDKIYDIPKKFNDLIKMVVKCNLDTLTIPLIDYNYYNEVGEFR